MKFLPLLALLALAACADSNALPQPSGPWVRLEGAPLGTNALTTPPPVPPVLEAAQ